MAEKKSINVCWISGSYYHRREFINKVKDQMRSKGGLEMSVFTDEETFEYCKSQIEQISCFSENRLIIFNDWPKHKSTAQTFQKHFIEMCKNLSEDTVIICNNLKTRSDKLLKAFKEMGKVVEYDEIVKTREAPGWFEGEMQRRGKVLSTNDARTAVQSLGEIQGKYGVSIDRMVSLAIKIESYVGKRKNISPEDIMTVCTDDPAFIIWSIYNSLDAKDQVESMRMVFKGEAVCKDVQSFVNQTLSSFIWRYRLLALLVECVAKGMEEKQIYKEAEGIFKLNREGSGLSIRYTVDKTEAGKPKPMYSYNMIKNMLSGYYQKPPVSCYTRKQAYLILEACIETQEKIRAGVTDAEATLMLDSLILTICGTVSSDDFRPLRKINNLLYC